MVESTNYMSMVFIRLKCFLCEVRKSMVKINLIIHFIDETMFLIFCN